MSILPRWDDDFSTDPTTDPAYRIGNCTYNGTDDRLEVINNVAASNVTKLNSNNSNGTVIADIDFFMAGNGSARNVYLRAFGYYFVGSMTNDFWVFPEDYTYWQYYGWSAGQITNFDRHIFYSGSIVFNSGQHILKVVKTALDVQFYADDILQCVVPAKSVVGDVEFGQIKNASSSSTQDALNQLTILADASLPKAPVIQEPSLGGSINASQEILVSMPESRLYLDLGTFAGSITGITNAVYDPSGLAVAMTENLGIPDGAGDTNGDFYTEIPLNGLASDYRLVLKESFVTTNSVIAGDDIDFEADGVESIDTFVDGDVTVGTDTINIIGHPFTANNRCRLSSTGTLPTPLNDITDYYILVSGPDDIQLSLTPGGGAVNITAATGGGTHQITQFDLQNFLVKEEDDLHCHLHLASEASGLRSPVSMHKLGIMPQLINANADGNLSEIVSAGVMEMFDKTFSSSYSFAYGAGMNFPVIIDLDLGKEYRIWQIATNNHAARTPYMTKFDVYSNTVPFAGAGIQGTLEQANYPTQADFTGPSSVHDMDRGPILDFKTRYVRLYATDGTFFTAGAPGASNQILRELDFILLDDDSINSSDDNAQFQIDTGGGFGAYAAGGETQGSGIVKITLPASLQLTADERKFMSIQFKPDLTD